MNNVPWVDFNIERGPIVGDLKSKVGLKFWIRTRPEVEQFMQNMSKGRKVGLDAFAGGTEWAQLTPDAGPLEAYVVNLEGRSKDYAIDAIGDSLLIEHDREVAAAPRPGRVAFRDYSEGRPQVNLSFLTLAGVSSEQGITIGVHGAVSFDYLQNAKTLFTKAVMQFLRDYVVPVTINLQIMSREL